MKQETVSQQTLNLQHLNPGLSSLQNCENYMFVVYKPSSLWHVCHSIPNRLKHMCHYPQNIKRQNLKVKNKIKSARCSKDFSNVFTMLAVSFLKYLFIYFDCTGSSLLRMGSPQLQTSGATLHCGALGFLLWQLLLLWSVVSRCFSGCGVQAQQV